ncbi:MAG: hypothetical protein JNL54_19730 [Kineosporiaceae bacterium]|nr:hypothetical protein [Kineosporiaceae bacterium]
MFDQAAAWLASFVADSLNAIWALLATTLFHLPDVTGLPQVAAVSARALTVVNTAFVVAIMVVGIVVMTRHTVHARYAAADLAPRLVIGLVAANFATPICRAIIITANALVQALTGEGIASTASLAHLLRVVQGALTNPAAALLTTLVGLIIDILLGLLLVGWIARFAALIVAVGIAPAALACHGLPWTEPIAATWWRTMGALAATVVLQAVALHTSLAVFLDPAANLPSYGLPADPTGLLNLIIVAVLLWVTVRIPALVRRHITQAGGRPNLAATVVRFVVVHQITRGLGRGLGGAFTGRRASTGGSSGGGGMPRGGPSHPPAPPSGGGPRHPIPSRPGSPPGPAAGAGRRPPGPPGTSPRTPPPTTPPPGPPAQPVRPVRPPHPVVPRPPQPVSAPRAVRTPRPAPASARPVRRIR